jgi:hypothetical protein
MESNSGLFNTMVNCLKVLASDNDMFIGDSQAVLDHYLTAATSSQDQNWLYLWKPLIMSSITEAKDISVWGVNYLSTYFPFLAPANPQ